MEVDRFLKKSFYFLLGGALFVMPLFSFAYDDKTTHPALTQEIVKLFNREFKDLKISDEDAEHIIQGSIDEDLGIRWMHHFYDPVYNRGFTYGTEWMSSKEWAQDTKKQAGFTDSAFAGTFRSFFSGDDDHSWDRAIYEYAWGNKERGLKALGHVLHLIEDAGVPDHTRNDPHPSISHFGSPYENWAKKFTKGSMSVSLLNKNMPQFANLGKYFDKVALYSNNHFFSKDSTCSNIYALPQISFERLEKLSDGKIYIFQFGEIEHNSYRLATRSARSNWYSTTNENKCGLFIDDNDDLILTDYWSLLSEQTILHGAGVVKLFFDEVEKERQTKTLYNKNKSWIGKQIGKFKKGVFGVASVLYGSSVGFEDIEDDRDSSLTAQNDDVEILPNPPFVKEGDNSNEASDNRDSSPADRNDEKKILPDPPLQKEGDNATKSSPPAGGGTSQQKKPQSRDTSDLLPIAGVGGPPAPELIAPPPPASPMLPPPPAPPADTEAPNISLTISECNQSLSPDGCLIATTTVTLEWSSNASDFSYYTIACAANDSPCSGFSIATTTATTTIYIAPSDTTTYIFTAKATDITGNTSAPKTKQVEVTTRPLVINEIAWAGTSASRSADEWIELFNTTSKTLDTSQVKLISLTDNKPNISLSGTIPAKGYYIIERTNDFTISDLTASTTAPFGDGSSGTGLSNSGETIAITYKGATIDETPAISDCGGWCGGAASGSYPTMERYDPYASGTDKENWGNGGDFLTNGKNADNIDIKGTPGKRNTINYLITKNGTTLSSNATITKSQSPYIIPSSGFTIQSGATLTIQPGIVIKFYSSNDPSLTVSGKMIAEGTQAENIVFTSLKDDTRGGDTNNDGSQTAPAAENWGSIKILSDGSILKYAQIRYGGKRDVPGAGMFANIRVENASTSITYSTVEYSGVYGVWLKTASGTVAYNTMQNNTRNISGQEKGTGIVVNGGAPDIRENAITKNIVGLSVDTEGSPAMIKNSFTQNTEDAAIIVSSYPSFSENTASGNGTNGIVISGTADKNFTLSSSLPFVTKPGSSYTVSSGKTLTIAPGTIFKMRGRFLVSGKLIAEGTAAENIIFTSLNDDIYGGNTNGTSTPPAIADWDHIAFDAGSASSSLKHFRARYGGDDGISAARGAIRITDTSIDVDNVTIEKNYYAGIYMTNSASTSITNSLVQDHTDLTSTVHYGIFLTSSSTPAISNTAFKNNETHIFSDGTSSSPESYIGGGNTFE